VEDLPKLLVEVYDKTLAYQGTVGVVSGDGATWTQRHFDIGTGTFMVDSDLDVVTALAAPGARVWVRYRYDPDDETQLMHVMSGPVSEAAGSGPGIAPTRTFTVTDDKDLVWNQMKCWPVPGSALTAQGGSTTFYSATGPVETVIKGLVSANKAHLPATAPPITVEANAARGETISALMRFESIADKLGTALLYGHMGFRLRPNGSSLLFEAYQPKTLTVPLSQDSGEVASGSWSLTRPTASRAYVRGGADTGAVLIERVNTAVEADHGYCGHTYVEVTETTDVPTLQAKGDEALNAAARTVSLQVELAETADWRVGIAFQLGDEVPVQLSGAPILTDTVTEVEFKQDKDNGLVITPRIGDHSGPNEQLAKAVQKIAGYQRSQKARG
jgi:hypothetical protein